MHKGAHRGCAFEDSCDSGTKELQYLLRHGRLTHAYEPTPSLYCEKEMCKVNGTRGMTDRVTVK